MPVAQNFIAPQSIRIEDLFSLARAIPALRRGRFVERNDQQWFNGRYGVVLTDEGNDPVSHGHELGMLNRLGSTVREPQNKWLKRLIAQRSANGVEVHENSVY